MSNIFNPGDIVDYSGIVCVVTRKHADGNSYTVSALNPDNYKKVVHLGGLKLLTPSLKTQEERRVQRNKDLWQRINSADHY